MIHEIVPRSLACDFDWREWSNRVALCPICHDTVHRDGAQTWNDRLIDLRNQRILEYHGVILNELV